MQRNAYRTGLLILLLIGMPSAQSSTSFPAEISQLMNIQTFSLGFVGFIGHISEGEILYKKIIDDKNAEQIFLTILHSSSATNEGKMYAICGLRKVAKENTFERERKKLMYEEGEVSILRTDILKKEKISLLLSHMNSLGCN